MTPYLIYDIETYKSDDAEAFFQYKPVVADARLKDPAKIEANIEKKRESCLDKAALSPLTGRITCMGVSYNGTYHFFLNKDEAELLTEIDMFISGKEISHFVGKNNLDFDLPYLRLRHMINNVPMPAWLHPMCRHLDIKSYFGKGMGNYGPSMADLEFVLGIKREGEKDAKQVFQWWRDGDYESLNTYNHQDVRTTEVIYLAMEGGIRH